MDGVGTTIETDFDPANVQTLARTGSGIDSKDITSDVLYPCGGSYPHCELAYNGDGGFFLQRLVLPDAQVGFVAGTRRLGRGQHVGQFAIDLVQTPPDRPDVEQDRRPGDAIRRCHERRGRQFFLRLGLADPLADALRTYASATGETDITPTGPLSKITQRGTSKISRKPLRKSTKAKVPMNFWPSLDPWLKAMNPADTTCSLPKTRRIVDAGVLTPSR